MSRSSLSGEPPSALPLVGFAIAVFGAFVSFLPLLQILLPLKAAAISPEAAASLIGPIAATGAIVAGAANVAAGWLSDRTRSRFGRRRPWIVAGALGVLLSYWVIAEARSATTLLVGVVLFQLTFNTMFAPLLALVPDRLPPNQWGRASGIIALGSPVGSLIGTALIGHLSLHESYRFLLLGGIVFLSSVPFVVLLAPDPLATTPIAVADRHSLTRDFILGCASRGCVIAAFTIAQLYLLFYVSGFIGLGGPHAAENGVSLLATLFGVTSAILALTMGRASDRLGRRKPFVVYGALLVGGGMLGLALAPTWLFVIAAYALFAVGAGMHMAVEFALMIDILPSHDRVARDLGILNLANVAPQVIAPLGLTWLLARPWATLQWGFAAGAVAAVAGAALVALIRSAR